MNIGIPVALFVSEPRLCATGEETSKKDITELKACNIHQAIIIPMLV
jgi:hypothetical protein